LYVLCQSSSIPISKMLLNRVWESLIKNFCCFQKLRFSLHFSFDVSHFDFVLLQLPFSDTLLALFSCRRRLCYSLVGDTSFSVFLLVVIDDSYGVCPNLLFASGSCAVSFHSRLFKLWLQGLQHAFSLAMGSRIFEMFSRRLTFCTVHNTITCNEMT